MSLTGHGRGSGGHVGCDQRLDARQYFITGLASELDVHACEGGAAAEDVRVHDPGKFVHGLRHGREHVDAECAAEGHIHAPYNEAGHVGVAPPGADDDLPSATRDGHLAARRVAIAQAAVDISHEACVPPLELPELLDDRVAFA